jgi:hypothetical protein
MKSIALFEHEMKGNVTMALEDYLEPEVGVAAAVAAIVFSPTGRKWLRKGAVCGLAGVFAAGDAISSAAQNVGRGIQAVSASATNAAHEPASQAQTAASEADGSVTRSSHKKTTPKHTTASSPMDSSEHQPDTGGQS